MQGQVVHRGGPDCVEIRVSRVGQELLASLAAVESALPDRPRGPAEVARHLGIDKVLASRVLKAINRRDTLASLSVMPGPDPLRRFVRAAARRGVRAALVDAAERAIRDFEELIRSEGGDRSALDALLCAWLPEAKAEFELRRKQAAFRAISQLYGVEAQTNLSTIVFHPSKDAGKLDVVMLHGLFGLHRMRPGVRVKFTSRRLLRTMPPRSPKTLEGNPVEDLTGLRLDEFCSNPLPELEVHRFEETVHYTVADPGFGESSKVDVVIGESNLSDIPRRLSDPRRRRFSSVGISTPVKTLLFDTLIHEDLLTGSEPSLLIYDTFIQGPADPNDPSRDIDRLDLRESLQSLGRGVTKFRAAEVPRYAEMLLSMCSRLGWSGERLVGFRTRIAYPVYGSQIAVAFDITTGEPT